MGNGDEASGDGFRYRGRGLIQITGKWHYRRFSRFVGDDVVMHPDRVASKYAVESAVYFWKRRHINDAADADDVKRVTRKVHGRLGGLAQRARWLERAKNALRMAPADVLGEPTHRVSATALNLRSSPRVAPSTRLAVLAEGTEVVRDGPAPKPGWARVRAVLGDRVVAGVVGQKFLRRIQPSDVEPEPPSVSIPAVHLKEGLRAVRRARDGGRAFPLGEPRMPRRKTVCPEALVDIVEYLDVENREHHRYRPRGGTTYCNIYAYDYCYLAGAYLPRVFWNDKALHHIARGKTPPVRYGRTVKELNANMLFDWLAEHGSDFGWKRELDLTIVQEAANAGEVCLIVAQREDLNRSGHITAVAPEHGDFKAARNKEKDVLRAVESQAGTRNHRFIVKTGAWWKSPRFRAFGFWRAE